MKTKTLYELHFYEYNRGNTIYHKEKILAYSKNNAICLMKNSFKHGHIEILYCEDKSDDSEN